MNTPYDLPIHLAALMRRWALGPCVDGENQTDPLTSAHAEYPHVCREHYPLVPAQPDEAGTYRLMAAALITRRQLQDGGAA